MLECFEILCLVDLVVRIVVSFLFENESNLFLVLLIFGIVATTFTILIYIATAEHERSYGHMQVHWAALFDSVIALPHIRHVLVGRRFLLSARRHHGPMRKCII